MSKVINGVVSYQNIGMGFWGIIDSKGNEWRPVNMPEQLKENGAKVSIRIKEVDEGVSMFMWGKAVKVVGFHTLSK